MINIQFKESKNIILFTAALFIVGVMIRHTGYPTFGSVVTIASIAFYLFFKSAKMIRVVRKFESSDAGQKWELLRYCLLMLFLISNIITLDVRAFLTLAVLGFDYFVERQKEEED